MTWAFKSVLGICCVDARGIHLLSQELGDKILCFTVVIRMSIVSTNKARWVLQGSLGKSPLKRWKEASLQILCCSPQNGFGCFIRLPPPSLCNGQIGIMELLLFCDCPSLATLLGLKFGGRAKTDKLTRGKESFDFVHIQKNSFKNVTQNVAYKPSQAKQREGAVASWVGQSSSDMSRSCCVTKGCHVCSEQLELSEATVLLLLQKNL